MAAHTAALRGHEKPCPGVEGTRWWHQCRLQKPSSITSKHFVSPPPHKSNIKTRTMADTHHNTKRETCEAPDIVTDLLQPGALGRGYPNGS